MKTNLEYLREAIKVGGSDIEEWLNAYISDRDDEYSDIESDNDYLHREIGNLESELENKASNLVKIDLGAGIIEYKEPDSLVLQSLMEDFASYQRRRFLKVD